MRVHIVKKARKDQGDCGSCHKPIVAGDGYQYIAPRYGPKKKRHIGCPSFRPSEMTSSKIATAYAAQEGGHDDLDAIDTSVVVDLETAEAFVDEVKSILATVAEGVGECRDDYQDGYDNMPENFQAGPTGEEIQEKIDILESFASELESFDPETTPEEHEVDGADEGIGTETKFESYAMGVIEEARAVIDSLEL